MHALPTSTSIRGFYLDLVYLNATLQAAGHNDLAAIVQTQLHELKHQRVEHERAEELEVVAGAAIAGRDLTLDERFKSAAAHVRAHHPEDFDHFFPKPPSRVVEAAYRDEIQAVRTLAAHLGALPAGDALRTEHAPGLMRAAEELEHALAQKDEVLQQFALVRASLNRVRAAVNLTRLETYGKLVERTKDKHVADKFFRPAVSSPKAQDATTTPPAAPSGSAPQKP